jgi:hypothetical protein
MSTENIPQLYSAIRSNDPALAETTFRGTSPELKTFRDSFTILATHIAPAALRRGGIEIYLAPDQLYATRPKRRLTFVQIVTDDEIPRDDWTALETAIPYTHKGIIYNAVKSNIIRLTGTTYFHQQPKVENLHLNPTSPSGEWYYVEDQHAAVHIQIGELDKPCEDLNGFWYERVCFEGDIPEGIQPTYVPNARRMDQIFQERGLSIANPRIPSDYNVQYSASSPALLKPARTLEAPAQAYTGITRRLSS